MPPFRYESQDTTLPYVGTIADLIQAGPNARAQGELRKGQAIGNAATSIGQTIGAIPGQFQQAQLNTQRLEAGKLELDAAKRAETAREAMNKLMADQSVLNEDGTFNWQEMQKKIPGADAQSLVGIVGPINDSILKTRDHQLQLRALKQASLGELATGILQISKGNPQAAEQLLHVGLSSAVKSGLMTQPEADQMITGFAQDPTQLLPTLELLARAAKRPDIKLSEGEELRSGVDPSRVVANNPKPPPLPTSASLALAAAGGDPKGATDILQAPSREVARHNAEMERIQSLTVGRQEAAARETARHNRAMEAAGQRPSFQSKSILDDAGNPIEANYDSKTGTYYAPDGTPVKTPKPVPSAQERMDSRKFAKAKPVLESVAELSEKINTQKGLIAKMSGGARKVEAQLNLDDDVAEYEALISMFTPMVARALGHTGMLTEPDVQSVRKGFPQPGESKSLRDRKVRRLLSIIDELSVESGGDPLGVSATPGADARSNPFRQ